MVSLSKNDTWFLIIIFILSFVLRAAVFQCYVSRDNRYWQVDSNTYHLIAKNIAEGKGISLSSGAPNFYRLPGYPVFIAFFYKLFGVDHYKALWGQIILASFIPLLLFFLACVLFPRKRWLAYGASSVGAIHLGLVLYSGFFMTESLFIVLLLLFLIFFFHSIHLFFCPVKRDTVCSPICQTNCSISFIPDPMPMVPAFTQLYERIMCACKPKVICERNNVASYMVLSGVFLGLASLVRPVGHYLVVIALVFLLISKDEWRVKIHQSILFFIAWLVPVSFWIIRNYILLGHIFFHTLPGGHFLYFSAARVVMHTDNVSYVQARLKVADQSHGLVEQKAIELGRLPNEIEECAINEKLARHYFTTYPLITIKLWLTDIFRTCFSLYSAELLYLENGRKEFDYFDKNRTWGSMFYRYLVPQTDNTWLKAIVYGEILFFFVLLLGFFIGLCGLFMTLFYPLVAREDICTWLRLLPFMALFIVVSLAGGYARMRLPIEPLLILLSLSAWWQVLPHRTNTKKHPRLYKDLCT